MTSYQYDKCVWKDDPKNLTQEQKDNWKDVCQGIMKRLKEESHLLTNVATCDETWIFQYNPTTKSARNMDFLV